MRLAVREACVHCEARMFCHPSGEERVIDARDPVGAAVGDTVTVEIRAAAGMTAFVVLFGLPLLFGLLGVIGASKLGNAGMLGAGVAGVGIGFACAKLIDYRWGRRFDPRVTAVVAQSRH